MAPLVSNQQIWVEYSTLENCCDPLYLWVIRKMYQGGSSRKQGPRLAIREPDHEPPREAQVRPCEWPSEDFMVQAGIKEEFEAYMRNANLEGFVSD